MKTWSASLFALALACTPPAHGPAAARPAPIAWLDFGAEAFARAKAEHKLVMVDAGIEGCTACRWMQQGAYHDAAVIRRVHDSFIAVSVDADQRPDLGARFEPWGWPATLFFLPDGKQVFALQGSEGAGEFTQLLDDLVSKQRAGTLQPSATGTLAHSNASNLEAVCLDANAQLAALADDTGWGSIRVAMMPPFEHAVLRGHARGDAALTNRARAVAEGETKILDPVWGGVYVAAREKSWGEPIPEKRTIHEAAALDAFALELHESSDKKWLARANDVRRYLEGWMLAPDGTFYSTQQDAAPNLPRSVSTSQYYALDDAGRRAYGTPPIDHGVYTEQNAAVIESYVRLFEASGDAAVLAIAKRAADELIARRMRADGGLEQAKASSWLAHDARLRAVTIDDDLYLRAEAEMGLALLMLYEATADEHYLAVALGIASAQKTLEDGERGGFFATVPRNTDVLIARHKPLLENATAARFLFRLSSVTRDASWQKSAERAMLAVATSAALKEEGPWALGLVALVTEEALLGPVEITIVGGDATRTRALHDYAVRVFEPRKIVRIEAPGHYPAPRVGAVAYVCTRSSCSSPLQAEAELDTTIARMAKAAPDAPCGR